MHCVVNIPVVILLAFARFGPINMLIPQILGNVQTLDLKRMEEWARTVCPAFESAISQFSIRFSDQALGDLKGFRQTLWLSGGSGRAFPLSLLEAADHLKELVERIELDRLEQDLGLTGPYEVSSVRPDSIKRQRIRDLEKLLEIEYEKLSEFQKELTINSSAAAKFELQQRLKREVLPDIRKHEVEYAGLLADEADPALIPAAQAEQAVVEVLQAVQHIEHLPDTSHSQEIARLMTEVKEKLQQPGKSAAAKLKVAVPIIPLIVSYEMELDTEALLTNAWRGVKRLFGGKV